MSSRSLMSGMIPLQDPQIAPIRKILSLGNSADSVIQTFLQ